MLQAAIYQMQRNTLSTKQYRSEIIEEYRRIFSRSQREQAESYQTQNHPSDPLIPLYIRQKDLSPGK